MQVDELRSQLDELKAAETESRLHDEMRKVKRDLTTAELRVMTLTAEVDELQANKERSTREFDQAMRVSDRTNHDLSANLKALTSELDSTKLHVHRLQVRPAPHLLAALNHQDSLACHYAGGTDRESWPPQ